MARCSVLLASAAFLLCTGLLAAAAPEGDVGLSDVVPPLQRRRSSTRYRRRQHSHNSDEKDAAYSFSYEVDAPYHGIWHDRHESSSGRKTEGRFRVALPDHRLQTVTYRATDDQGFLADVHFEQHPNFQALRGNIGKSPNIGEPVVSSFKVTRGPKPVFNKDSQARRKHPTKSQGHHPISSRPNYGEREPALSKPFQRGNKYYLRPSTPLSAFVSIAPHRPAAAIFTTSRPVTQNIRNSDFSGYLPTQAPLLKKQVPSRPLRTKLRSTFKPSKIDHTKSSLKNLVSQPQLSFGQKSRPSRVRFTPERNLVKPTSSVRGSNKRLSSPRGSGKTSIPSRNSSRPTIPVRVSNKRPTVSRPASNSIPNDLTIQHLPEKDEPLEVIEPPATQDESFSIVGKEHRYAIRSEGMNSVRSRLNSIVHP